MKLEIYVDGACSGNPGKGGWAYELYHGGALVRSDSRGYAKTTNNRMEMMAVRFALAAAREACQNWLRGVSSGECIQVFVYSDSQLVVNTLTAGWSRRSNEDLWARIDTELAALKRVATVTFVKIKGHSGNPYNERVDRLAVAAYNQSDYQLVQDEGYHDGETAASQPLTGSLFDQANSEQVHDELSIEQVTLRGFNKPTGRYAAVLLNRKRPNGGSEKVVVNLIAVDGRVSCLGGDGATAAATVGVKRLLSGWLLGGDL